MSQSLATYLHDHLAGAQFAIELLKTLRDAHAGQPISVFAGELLSEIEQDRQILALTTDRVGKTGLDAKEATAWLGEKIARFKLRHDDPAGLGTFEALEGQDTADEISATPRRSKATKVRLSRPMSPKRVRYWLCTRPVAPKPELGNLADWEHDINRACDHQRVLRGPLHC